MKVSYAPSFIRQLNALEEALREEAIEKIELFGNTPTHQTLKVHKLHGVLKGRYGFSVNYKTRIVFIFLNKSEAVLLSIGSHDVYR